MNPCLCSSLDFYASPIASSACNPFHITRTVIHMPHIYIYIYMYIHVTNIYIRIQNYTYEMIYWLTSWLSQNIFHFFSLIQCLSTANSTAWPGRSHLTLPKKGLCVFSGHSLGLLFASVGPFSLLLSSQTTFGLGTFRFTFWRFIWMQPAITYCTTEFRCELCWQCQIWTPLPSSRAIRSQDSQMINLNDKPNRRRTHA